MAGSDSLRGASSQALATLDERLTETLEVASAPATADGLFAVADLLRRESGLRRAATDPSAQESARGDLLRGLLEGRVDPVAVDVSALAAGQRWTTTRDLPDALEHLGVVASVRSAPDDADRLADELFAVARLVQTEVALRDALGDPARSRADKTRLLDDLFADRTLPATAALVRQALSGSHRSVNAALEDYQRVAADVHSERVATVRVARSLGASDQQRLQTALSRQYGRQVHLNVLVQPDLIGGLRVEIGDDVIDGSVLARLDDVRRRLAG